MRANRRLIVLLATTALLGVLPSQPSVAQAPPEQPLLSGNVELLTSIPQAGVIGARFRKGVMYVTSVTGLTTYDIGDPANPVLLGALPLPHFENEDVDLGGDILLISNDAAESTGILYVIDISDPAMPALLTAFPLGGAAGVGGPGHTASCVMACRYAWVTDGGTIKVIDLTDPAVPVDKGNFEPPTGGIATHDVQTDANGLVWVAGFNGTAAYRLPADYSGGTDPNEAQLVAQTNVEGNSTYEEELGLGDGSNFNDYIHHNSFRRANDDVLFVTEEDYTRPACQGAGSFQTWRIPTNSKGKPTGAELTPLGMWQPELLRDLSAAPAMCSAHYFDLDRNVVAQGWYEMGIRFLDVSNPEKIRQIGYFMPPTAMTWAAHFAPTDKTSSVVYVLDATHGIDVLRLTRPAKGPLSAPAEACRTQACRDRNRPPGVRAPVLPQWSTGTPLAGLNPTFGWACRFTAPLIVE